MEKRFYWLKLKENYFDSPKIKKLRRIAGGDTLTIIYLKMQLLSVSNSGIIEFEGIESCFEEELALKLDEDVENVRLVLAYLQAQDLIAKQNEEYLLLDVCKNVGSESSSAERVRRFREIKQQNALQCNADVTPVLQNSISISNISNLNSKSNIDNSVIDSIIDYLNQKAGTHYKSTTPKTKQFIKARLNEKFTEDDFKAVIDKKCNEWLGTDMEQYLRPETLFGTKFESYLNQKVKETFEQKLQRVANELYGG